MSADEIEDLLVKARDRNAAAEVTGLLLYDSGNFMQCLEGTPGRLMEIYGRIRSSKLHSGIIELLRAQICAREFGEWPMAFRVINTYGMSQSFGESDSVLQKLEFTDAPPTAARILLSNFWRVAKQQSSFTDSML